MKLSVVTSLYRSAPHLPEFVARASAAAAAFAGDEWEMILVNDGSPDASLEAALAEREKEPRIKVVDLSRNFGHHKALMTGVSQARGEWVYLIDCDLEEPPELLSELTAALAGEPEADVAYGVQKHRRGGWFERVSGAVFYRLMRWSAEFDYPADPLTARLMSRRYVEALKQFDEREYDLWVNFALAGFRQLPVPAEKGDKGSSAYTLRRKVRHAVESLTASGAGPLYLIFILGWIIFLASLAQMAFLVINKLFFQVPWGWSYLTASIWGLGGIIMISLGTVGIYLAKVFVETKKRPGVIIRRVYDERDPRP